MLLPDPATELRDNQGLTLGEGLEQRTFSVYPQEGTGGLPSIEYTPLKKPFSSTVVVSFACNVVINGWIRRRKPS